MVELQALWLPILLSGIGVFVLSSVIHMALPWHKNDYPKAPKEDQIMDALRPLSIPPGDYMIPRPSSMKEMSSPEFVKKLDRGPVMQLRMSPNGPMPMGPSLAMWFVYSLVIGLFAAYVASRTLPIGTPYLAVFRIVGTTAFLGYSAALSQMSIWYRRPWAITIKSSIDGLIYALVSAGLFGWLWPR